MTKDREFIIYMEERGMNIKDTEFFLENLSFFMEGERINNYIETMEKEFKELEYKKNDIKEELESVKTGALDMIIELKTICDSYKDDDAMIDPVDMKKEIERMKYFYIL